jgi:hypothetical protein
MSQRNLYFIVDYPPSTELLTRVVEQEEFRMNNDKTKCVVKFPVGRKFKTKEFTNKNSFTHEEILNEMEKEEWKSPDVF